MITLAKLKQNLDRAVVYHDTTAAISTLNGSLHLVTLRNLILKNIFTIFTNDGT